jgi:hypothetical protein
MKHFVKFIVEQYEKQGRIDDFVKFAAEFLNLEVPKVILLPEREPDMTTASYNMKNGEIKVYIKGRAAFDICRSIAHEMVHAAQHKKTDDLDGSTGSPHEDEANAIAGRIVRMYGKQNPDFYE